MNKTESGNKGLTRLAKLLNEGNMEQADRFDETKFSYLAALSKKKSNG